MSILIEVSSWVLIILGAFFVLVGGIGVLRMPDFYTRLHGSSLTDSLGTFAVLFGLMLQFGLTLATLKLVAIALFLYLTNPTAAYALAHAALLAKVPGLASRPHEED